MIIKVLRGLPGSGKSTKARAMQAGTGAILIEPDMFLIEDGEYRYTAERYAAAVERSYVMLELLTGTEFDRREVKLRPDIIYADVLPMAGDIFELLRHVNPNYTVELETVEVEDPRICRSIHKVNARDYSRMVRVFERIEFDRGRFIFHGRQYGGDWSAEA